MASPMLMHTKAAAQDAGLWTRETMGERISSLAKQYPSLVAYVDGDSRITWADVDAMSLSLARALLSLELRKDEIVFAQIPNSNIAIVIRYALQRAGLIGTLIPMQWREREVARAVERARPAACIVADGFKGADLISIHEACRERTAGLREILTVGASARTGYVRVETLLDQQAGPSASVPLPGFASDEVSWLLTSSGSTGLPKLVEWQGAAQLLTSRVGVEDMQLEPSDVIGVFAPLSGYAGLYASVWGLSCPVRTVLADEFRPERLLATIESERITIVSTVPPVLVKLTDVELAGRFDLSSLRAIRVGTAQLTPGVREKVERIFGCPVLAAAGSMETGVFAECRPGDPRERRLSQGVGLPPTGITCRVIDDDGREVARGQKGELIVRSALGASGYYGDEEGSRKAWSGPGGVGWYHTGDLAVFAEDGTLTLLGRKKDIINRGGNKILPLEVERAVMQHPAVLNVAVVGVVDEVMGEVPCAYVVSRWGQETSTDDLQDHLRRCGLATYKVPRHFLFVDELPLLGNGKVDREQLREGFRPVTAGGQAG